LRMSAAPSRHGAQLHLDNIRKALMPRSRWHAVLGI
jgi:hypothetical protein